MEQIELEQIKLLAHKAQLMDELKAVEAALSNAAAFAQGFASATHQEEPKPTKE